MIPGLISDEEGGDAGQTLDIKPPKPKVALIEDPKQSQVCMVQVDLHREGEGRGGEGT